MMTEQEACEAETRNFIRFGKSALRKDVLPENDAGKIIGKILSHIDSLFNITEEYGLDEREQGKAIVNQCGKWLKFCPQIGWLVYREDAGCYQAEYADAIVYSLVDEFALMRKSYAKRKAEYDFADRMISNHGVKAVLEKIKHDPAIYTDIREFDKNIYEVNCRGTVVNVKTGETRPAGPDDLFLKSTGCEVAAGDEYPEKFGEFLAEVTSKDGEPRFDLAEWILTWFGYSLTADVGAEYFVNFWGDGQNGKSILLAVMEKIAGKYAAALPLEVVLMKGTRGSFDLSMLPGVRMATISDVPRGRLNTAQIKPIVTGDFMSVEKKFKEPISFNPVCKITLSSNFKLNLSGETGKPMRRRLRFVPFDWTVPDDRVVPKDELLTSLMAEGPCVLRLLLDYAHSFYERGGGPNAFPKCEAIDAATTKYLIEEDEIGQFFGDRVITDEGELVGFEGGVKKAALYSAYVVWAGDQGTRPLSAKRMHEQARKVLGETEHRRDGDYYLKCRLREE